MKKPKQSTLSADGLERKVSTIHVNPLGLQLTDFPCLEVTFETGEGFATLIARVWESDTKMIGLLYPSYLVPDSWWDMLLELIQKHKESLSTSNHMDKTQTCSMPQDE